MTRVAGIDLGGTKIFGAHVEIGDGAAHLVSEAKRSTPTDGADAIADAVAAVVHEVVPEPDLVGVGTPGVIDPASGRVLFAPNLTGFDRPVALAELVSERVGAPVVLGNDVNLAALGEARLGAAAGRADLLAVWMGTGLGAGLVLDGRLRAGPSGLAGELGHVTVVPGGRECPCGGRGHLEAYIGRRAMELTARRLHESGRPTRLVELAGAKPMKSKVFRTAYDEGDAVAVELIDEGLELLGLAVANVVVTVDVTTVVVGGGLGERLGAVALDRLRNALGRLGYAGVAPEVVGAALGDHAGAIGAAVHAADAAVRTATIATDPSEAAGSTP